jgi:hypothetical protein
MTTSYLDGNSVNGMIHEIGHSFGGEHLDGGYWHNKSELGIVSGNARQRPFHNDSEGLRDQKLDRIDLYNNVYTLDFTLRGKRF